MRKWLRLALAVGGFVVTILTAPVLVQDEIPDGFKWWRNELADLGGSELQLAVVLLALAAMAVGLFGDRLRSGSSAGKPHRPTGVITETMDQLRAELEHFAQSEAGRAGRPPAEIGSERQVPPPPNVDLESLTNAKQRSHIEALLREREGYILRLDSWSDRLPRHKLRDRIRQVDEQIRLARDEWWEPEIGVVELDTPIDTVLQAATRTVQDELLSIRRAVDDAIKEREPPRHLPAAEWHRYKDVFSDPRYAFRDHVRRFCRDAYIAADRVNHRAERWSAPLGGKELSELRELRELVSKPIRVMNLVLGSWGPNGSKREAPDPLDEWLLEHRKKGLDIRHRAKTWTSRELSGKAARWVWWQTGGGTDMLVTWVLNLQHRLDRDRPADLGRFQTEGDERVLVYGDDEVDAAEKARLFSRNLSELTSLLTDRGLMPERAPGQELRDWLADGFNRGEDMLRDSAELRTPYGESIYFHKAALEWEQGIHALLASRRPDLAIQFRSQSDLPDELRPNLKPQERAETHPASVRLMLRRRLYRLEKIMERNDL